MKSKDKNNPIKVIGKNCKWNEELIIKKRKHHQCSLNLTKCGLNHTCDCFNNNGKLCFERKNDEEK